MEDNLLQSNSFVARTLIIKETSGPLLIVGWNDGSNEEVCNSNKKNDQKDHLSLEWQSKKKKKPNYIYLTIFYIIMKIMCPLKKDSIWLFQLRLYYPD